MDIIAHHEKRLEQVAPLADLRCLNQECRLYGIKLEPDEVDVVGVVAQCEGCHGNLANWSQTDQATA